MLNLSNKVRISTATVPPPSKKTVSRYGSNSHEHSMVNDPNSSISSAAGLARGASNINRQSLGEITGIGHGSIDRSMASNLEPDEADY